MAGVTSSALLTGLPMASVLGNSPGGLLRTPFHGTALAAGVAPSSAIRAAANSRTILCTIGDVDVVQPKGAQLKERPRQAEKSGHLETGNIVFSEPKREERKSGFTVKKPPFYAAIPNFLIDKLEDAIFGKIYGSERPENYFMQGNYGPVEESSPKLVLSVKGHIPECLNGEILRVGPNPSVKPKASYSWFDGDGMMHGLKIKDGKASYVCRYVKTSRFQQEDYWGGPKFRRIGDLTGKKGLFCLLFSQIRVACGVIDASNGFGNANTAFSFHNGKLLTLNEADKPYVVRILEDGDLETVDRLDFDEKLDHPFTAHPKLDPDTGELFTFGYQIQDPSLPYVTYRVISKDGVMGDPVPITPSGPVMMHDFAITEKYAIFMDHPLYFMPKDMVKKNQYAFAFDDTKPARFGILPRYAKNESEMKWFEFSTGIVFHNANAWEEGDEVVLISSRSPSMDLSVIAVYDKAKCDAFTNQLWEYRFNMKTGKAVERPLGDCLSDFPRINDQYIGRKNRFVYLAVMEDATHNIGVVKYDLTKEPELGKAELEVGGSVAGVFWHGASRYGSEAFFVPKSPGREVDEDDGYLVNFVFDEKTSKSEVIVIDAKTMSAEPVAVIEVPSRMPYGFHGMFVSEKELQLQKA